MASGTPLRLYSACGRRLAGPALRLVGLGRELVSLVGCMNYRRALVVLARSAVVSGLLAAALA